MIDVREALAALLLGMVTVASAGCGDASRATATPPPAAVKGEPRVERDVPISVECVRTRVGHINAQSRARVAADLVGHHYPERSPAQAGHPPLQRDPRPRQTG